MALSITLFLKISLFAACSSALGWNGIVARETDHHDSLGKQPPLPTQAAVARPDLFRRGPANEICGFSSDGTTIATLTCNFGALCATNGLGGFECIKSNYVSSTVPLVTSCVDTTNYAECSSDCLSDPLLEFCTSAEFPYCLTTVFDYQDLRATTFSCGNGAQTTDSELYTLTAGGVTAASPVYITWHLSTTMPSPTPSPTTPPVAPTVSSSSAPVTSTSPPPAPAKKTPVGAIAGGAVGGVAVIAAVIVGIIFIMRRKKKQAAGTAPYDPRMSQPESHQPYHPQQPPQQPPQQQYVQPGGQPQQGYFQSNQPGDVGKPAMSPDVYQVPTSPQPSKAGYSESEGPSSPRLSVAPPYSPIHQSGTMSPASPASELHATPVIHEL